MWGVVGLAGAEADSVRTFSPDRTPLQTTVGRQVWMERGGQAVPNADGAGFLVKFKPASLAAQAATLQVGTLTLQRQDHAAFFGYHLYRAAPGSLQAQDLPADRNVLAALAARIDVASVIPDTTLWAFATPNDRLHALQWDR